MCHDIIKYPLNEIIRELKIINQNISTHRIFHTPHFPHSAFSTLRNPHNLSMRALAKILRAQASEHSSNFCEQFEQRSDFASTFKFDVTIRYCSLSSSTLTRKDGVKSTVRQLALSPQCQGLRRKCFRGKINSIFLNAKGCNETKTMCCMK